MYLVNILTISEPNANNNPCATCRTRQTLRNENCAYLNFDDQNLLEKWDEDLVMATLSEIYPDYKYLLLDEVQNLPQWDLRVSKL